MTKLILDLDEKEIKLLKILITCGYDGICEDEDMADYDNLLKKVDKVIK